MGIERENNAKRYLLGDLVIPTVPYLDASPTLSTSPIDLADGGLTYDSQMPMRERRAVLKSNLEQMDALGIVADMPKLLRWEVCR